MNHSHRFHQVARLGLALALTATAVSAQLSFTEISASSGVSTTYAPPDGLDTSPMLSGGGAGDFNNDGFQDLFVVTGGSRPDRLFINNGDGTFTNQATAWGVDRKHIGGGVAIGDYDNDGWLDIFVNSHGTDTSVEPGHHILWHNNGDGSFTDVAAAAGVQWTSLTDGAGYGAGWGDYDLDGDLDLFSTSWLENVGGNKLFRNNGDGTFTDVTAAAIPTDLAFTRGFSPNFVDMDGDHDPELLLAADFGGSRYFINNGDGTFTDFTAGSGTALDSNGMGQSVADIDRDGKLDWYVTSIHYDEGTGSGSGNMLYRSLGGHVYEEISMPSGVNNGGWGWGTVMLDLDQDGLLDIAETNGIFAPMAGSQWEDEQAYIWLQGGHLTFTDANVSSGLNYNEEHGRGMLRFDCDNDGDQDLAFFAWGAPMKLFRNDLGEGGSNGLRVLLDNGGSTNVAPNGYGSQVEVDAGGETWIAPVVGNTPYLSQSELSAHFGLGAHALVDQLRVLWADGTVSYLNDVGVNQSVTVGYHGWKDEGPALAGTGSVEPTLHGVGELAAGEVVSLSLRQALANAPATLILGLSVVNLPFKGGVMVPAPDAMIGGFVTDNEGELLLSGGWPGGIPAGSVFAFQYWIEDAGAAFGYSASNGVTATAP